MQTQSVVPDWVFSHLPESHLYGVAAKAYEAEAAIDAREEGWTARHSGIQRTDRSQRSGFAFIVSTSDLSWRGRKHVLGQA